MELAIVTTGVAVIVVIITYGQWVNGRNQLKLALFEKRYAVYEKISQFLAETLQAGKVKKGAEIEFLRETKRVYLTSALCVTRR